MPIVYLDRDTLGLVEDTYGLTITTVVVKPKSRGSVRLRSADPDDMPLVSPNLLKDPADAKAMIDGQRFFLRAFETKPLAEHVKRVAIPDPADRSDEALLEPLPALREDQLPPERHLPHGAAGRPDGGARFAAAGAGGRGAAGVRPVGDAEHQRRQHDAPALMLGSRCAEFLLGRQGAGREEREEMRVAG